MYVMITIFFPLQNLIETTVTELIPCVFVATKADLPVVEQVL